MEVFIGWSGSRSLELAKTLGTWLEKFFKPGLKAHVLGGSHLGDPWWQRLEGILDSTNEGVFCVTREGASSTWMPYEAGRVYGKDGRCVIPYCLGIDPGKIGLPLGLFQATRADEKGTRGLVHSINGQLPKPESPKSLDRRFDRDWPAFCKSLNDLALAGPGLNRLREFEAAIRENSETYPKAEEIVAIIPELGKEQRFVIALCGPAAIGKSTFAGVLRVAIRRSTPYSVSILPTDAYALMTREEKEKHGMHGYEPKSHDLQRLKASVEDLVLHKKSVRTQPYKHEMGKFGGRELVQPAKVLIVEGVYSFDPLQRLRIPARPGSRGIGGYRVYLRAEPWKSKELRFAANITKRNYTVEQAFERMDENYDSYREHIEERYRKHADFPIFVSGYWSYS